MKYLFAVLLSSLFFTSSTLFAQPDSLWSRTYGGGNDDGCTSVIHTLDGGYALAGYTESFGAGGWDFWLLKTDENGDSLWSHTFGGEDRDFCSSLIQTADSGFVLAGYTNSFGAGGNDYWLIRTDKNGDSLWSRTYGGAGQDWCYSLNQTADGGFVIAGYTYSFGMGNADVWIVQTDDNGDSLWSGIYGTGWYEFCKSLTQTTDGGFALAGDTYGDYSDFLMIITDENGNMISLTTFQGRFTDKCQAIITSINGGYALAGNTWTSGLTCFDFWLVNTDGNGDSLWSSSYGGTLDEKCHVTEQTEDGGFILAGSSDSFGAGWSDFWMVRTDENGDSLWSLTFGGEQVDVCKDLIQTRDKGFVMAGYTQSFGAGGADFWLVKTGPDPVSVPKSDFSFHPSAFTLLTPYPNPFNNSVRLGFRTQTAKNLKVTITDQTGRLIENLFQGYAPIGESQIIWDASKTPAGNYFITVTNEQGLIASEKITLIK